MADQYIQLATDGAGKKVDVSELTVNAQTVQRQRVCIGDNTGATQFADVSTSAPGYTEAALVTRTVNYGAFGTTIAAVNMDSAGNQGVIEAPAKVNKRFWAVGHTSGASGTEIMVVLNQSIDNSAVSSATSFVITSGKTLRILGAEFGVRGHSSAANTATVTYSIRTAATGTVAIASPQIMAARCANAGVSFQWDRNVIPVAPGALDIVGDGTRAVGVSIIFTGSTNVPTIDVLLLGYEY